jgi:hypothetical protein
MYVSKQIKKNQHVSFAEDVEKSDQEERTARGFAARKERRELRKRLKIEGKHQLAKAWEDLKTASVSNIMEAGKTVSAYQGILSLFLQAMGSPEEITGTLERLKWFQLSYREASIEVFKHPDHELAKGYLEVIYTNRDYKNTFTNSLSISPSENSDDRATLLSAEAIDAIAHPAGALVDDSNKRSQLECNTASNEVKKRKTEEQAQEDGKEEGRA